MFAHSLKKVANSIVQRNVRMSSTQGYETLLVTIPKPFIYHVELNRPQKKNAMNHTMWLEIGKCFQSLDRDPDCRVVILSGQGTMFSSGLDFRSAAEMGQELAQYDDVARKAKFIHNHLTQYQRSLSSLEICGKPVLSAVHSACIGGAVDLIASADMRYCTQDAWFQVKEVDLGMAADVGTLQRLPKIIGSSSLTRELCFTGRKLSAQEALQCGLVSSVYENKESLVNAVMKIAEEIASKSPVAVQTTKRALIYARDHTVQEGLDQMALLNQCMLQSEDFATAVMALITKEEDKTVFAKL